MAKPALDATWEARAAELRSLSVQYNLPIVRHQVRPETLEEIKREKPDLGIVGVLYQDVVNNMALDRLHDFITHSKAELSSSLYHDLLSDYHELAADLSYAQSELGRDTIAMEAWVLEAREELKRRAEYSYIYVGRGKGSPLRLVISGLVQGAHELSELKEIVQALDVKWPPEYQIELLSPG